MEKIGLGHEKSSMERRGAAADESLSRLGISENLANFTFTFTLNYKL